MKHKREHGRMVVSDKAKPTSCSKGRNTKLPHSNQHQDTAATFPTPTPCNAQPESNRQGETLDKTEKPQKIYSEETLKMSPETITDEHQINMQNSVAFL